MNKNIGVKLGFLVAAITVGFFVTLLTPNRTSPKTTGHIRNSLVSRELRILNPEGSPAILFGMSEGPALWMSHHNAAIQMGVHGNGTPLLLVTDKAVRNFGLGRIDGAYLSPILVFRTNDVVRMVFGLSMTEPEQSPFLVHWTTNGMKSDFLGHYCDNPSRVCTQ